MAGGTEIRRRASAAYSYDKVAGAAAVGQTQTTSAFKMSGCMRVIGPGGRLRGSDGQPEPTSTIPTPMPRNDAFARLGDGLDRIPVVGY